MRRMTTILAALALAAPPAAAAAGPDPCEESLQNCDLSSSQVIPMESRTIGTLLELRTDNGPRALELYRSLVPHGYEMPEHPQVGVYLVEPNVPNRVDGQPYNDYTRWIEGAVSLRVRRGDRDGFLPLVMPVTSNFEYDLGRAAGLPKYHAEGEMGPSGTAGYRAQTRVGGRPSVTLDWQPAAVQPSDDLKQMIRQRFPLYALFPALKGPDLFQTKFTVTPRVPQPQPAPVPPLISPTQPEAGLLHVVLDPDLDRLDPTLPDLLTARHATLTDLVAPDQTVPGMMWNVVQNLVLESKKIGTGGGYGDPPRAAAPSSTAASLGLPSARTCASRRRFALHLRAQPGERIVAARVLRDGRRVRVGRPRGGRVTVDLRGLPARRVRITVVAQTDRHRTVTVRRSYRTCAR